MIHELRTYHCMPGRLPDVLKRFEQHTVRIWKRFGIEAVGYWTTQIGPSNMDLIYMLKWQSLADREAKWSAFARDPEYAKVRVESEANGPLVASVANQILVPTSFSPVA